MTGAPPAATDAADGAWSRASASGVATPASDSMLARPSSWTDLGGRRVTGV
jgi:hypothetical protein